MSILFDLVFLLYSIVYFPYLLLTGRWHPDYLQRLGIFSADVQAQLAHRSRNIWVHAVSVGEVMAIEGLISRIKARWPNYAVVCSVTTKTGYELAQKRLGNTACVIFSPLDLSFIVRAFSRRILPKMYIAAETELWPNLFGQLYKDKVPMAVINGRISDRSIGRYRMIKSLLKGVLAKVNVFAMQSDLDVARIKELGAAGEKVFSVGNIKFDEPLGAAAQPKFKLPEPSWIAGSTHPGEEKIVLEVYKDMPGWHLVLAPRHVQRTEEVMQCVRDAGFEPVRYSAFKGEVSARQVIVVDIIGYLKDMYASAALVFVGKSLYIGGGHNVIEPALHSKPIVIGPMMANFRDITACFKNAKAIVQVADTGEFKRVVLELANDEPWRSTLGKNARAVIEKNRGASERTLELLARWL